MAPFGKSQLHTLELHALDARRSFGSHFSNKASGDMAIDRTIKRASSIMRNSTRSSKAAGNTGTDSPRFGNRKSHAVFMSHLQAADPDAGTAIHDNVYGDEFAAALLDEIDHEVFDEPSFAVQLRARLAHIVMGQRFEMCIGIIIITNFLVIAFETDARSRKDNSTKGSTEFEFAEACLDLTGVLNIVYLVVYSIECCVRMIVFRWDFFRHMWNNFDLAIVITGILTEICGIILMQSSSVEAPQGLRTLRIIRMLRASRVLVSFDELYALVSGLKNAMKTLMWAGGLMLMVLTMWSILAVEYVKPLMSDIAAKEGFGQCEWCHKAFDNVFWANLTFFQMISGDGWSNVARPLIEGHVWTALLFVAVIFSMVFGLLNLIVAVIVDSAHQAREADIMNMAAKKDAARAAAWDCFSDLVNELDENGDGDISVEELKTGVLNNHDLSAYLTVMGIEEQDLAMVFELLDADGDGSVTHEEFTHQLYQMKTQELPIAVCYIRHSVSKLHAELKEVSDEIQKRLEDMLGPKGEVARRLASTTSEMSPHPSSRKTKVTMTASDAKQDTSQTPSSMKQGRVSLFTGKRRPSLRPTGLGPLRKTIGQTNLRELDLPQGQSKDETMSKQKSDASVESVDNDRFSSVVTNSLQTGPTPLS